jgi:hypothetical protein
MADFVLGIIIFVPRVIVGFFRLAGVPDVLAVAARLTSGVRTAPVHTRADFGPGMSLSATAGVSVARAEEGNSSPPER